MAEEYTCTLTDKSLKKAKKELNEDPKNRMGAVETLREWIEQQKHLTCDTRTESLLPFLRTAKFSQLRAREIIEGNMDLITKLPNWYQELDPNHPGQLEGIKMGILIPLPGVDKDGQKILLFRQGAMDKDTLKKMNADPQAKNDMFKSMMLIITQCMFDENVQVNGFIYLNDFSGYSMAHMSLWSMQEIKDIMSWQGKVAGRFKGFYYYNTGALFETVMELVKPLSGKKFKDRIRVLGNNMEKVYKEVPMHMFPEEYLPDDYTGPNAGSLKSITDDLIKELQKPEMRDRIVYKTKKEWGSNKALKDADAPVASFRKLNVD